MIKRNKNWWGIINKETKEIVDVLKTRDSARYYLGEYNLVVPKYKIEKVFVITEKDEWGLIMNQEL